MMDKSANSGKNILVVLVLVNLWSYSHAMLHTRVW